MSASMHNMSVFRKFGRFWSYSRITCIRFQQRRCLQEAVTVPEATYDKDKQGNLVGPSMCPFPEGLNVDPEVEAEYAKDSMRYPKYHPGITRFRRAPRLPERLVKNARLLLAENDLIGLSSFEADVKHLQQVYLRRQPPIEENFKFKQLQIYREKLMEEEIEANNINVEELNEMERKKFHQRVDSVAKKIFKKSFHGWNQIEYKDHTGLVYLAERLAPNYTVLLKIFDEIQKFDSNFIPEAVLNIGSGVGSAVWAVNNIWAEKVHEYYNVDYSSYMNDIARRLLAKDVADPLNPTIPGVHFRKNIPSPEHVHNSFPMVVSAYLLMEQPSFDDRMNLISLLWELTDQYLVLVEHGTTAGYRLMMEAREIVLQIGKDHPDHEGYVFAPCTHDMMCPKLQLKNLPCTFSIEYRKLNIGKDKGRGDEKATERYSYLVFKKGSKQEGKRYSRVTKALHKSAYSHCQACCPDGSLRQFIITKKRHSLALYKCAKRCQEGDFLPIVWPSSGAGIEEQESSKEEKSVLKEQKYNNGSEDLGSDKTNLRNDSDLQEK